MANFVIMPREDYIAICDAVREKADIDSALMSGDIASAIESIDTSAPYDGVLGDYISGEIMELEIPDDVTTIRNYGFYRMNSLEVIKISDSINRIGVEAFRECPLIVSVTMPAGLESIAYRAFSYCQTLQSVTFMGTPEIIQSDVFKGSPVSDIYVPWREGAVANAPWGAVDATVHYNTEVTK